MNVVIIIFMIVATIFALGALGYVAFDVYMELRSKKVREQAAEDLTSADAE